MKKIIYLIRFIFHCLILLFLVIFGPIHWLIYSIKLFLWYYDFDEYLDTVCDDFNSLMHKINKYENRILRRM